MVLTEMGISDLAQHYFVKAGVTALRRLRKTDNNRIARVTGATICHRPLELTDAHVGLTEKFLCSPLCGVSSCTSRIRTATPPPRTAIGP